MTTEELDEPMATFWNMRVATLGPGEWINVTPLWFGWIAGRGCTVLVDRNPKLQAAMFQGHATVLEDAGQEGVDEHLEEVCWLMGRNTLGDKVKRATGRRAGSSSSRAR